MIYRSLLKYSYSCFSLEILEYCDRSEVVTREQYDPFGVDLLKPYYNILKIAGSFLGFKHSPKTIAKMKNRIWTEEQKAKHLERLKNLHANLEYQARRLEHLKNLHLSKEHQEHLKRLNLSQKGRPRPEGAGLPSVALEVFDTKNNEAIVYEALATRSPSYGRPRSSISEAARAIGVTETAIRNAFKRKGESTIYIKKKRYQVTKLSGSN